MFCSNCGAPASGKFCAQCGAPLAREAAAAVPPAPLADWSAEVRYDALVRIPAVRDRIAAAAADAQKHLSADEVLAIAGKVLKSADFKTAELISRELGQYLGVKTGKVRTQTLSLPPGKAIVAALCSMAAEGQDIRHVRQADDGCLFEATIPSDFRSREGTLYVTIRRDDAGSRVEAATDIKGQLYDWGKSTRCLDRLFAALASA
jgi:hypothetical protein